MLNGLGATVAFSLQSILIVQVFKENELVIFDVNLLIISFLVSPLSNFLHGIKKELIDIRIKTSLVLLGIPILIFYHTYNNVDDIFDSIIFYIAFILFNLRQISLNLNKNFLARNILRIVTYTLFVVFGYLFQDPFLIIGVILLVIEGVVSYIASKNINLSSDKFLKTHFRSLYKLYIGGVVVFISLFYSRSSFDEESLINISKYFLLLSILSQIGSFVFQTSRVLLNNRNGMRLLALVISGIVLLVILASGGIEFFNSFNSLMYISFSAAALNLLIGFYIFTYLKAEINMIVNIVFGVSLIVLTSLFVGDFNAIYFSTLTQLSVGSFIVISKRIKT